MNVQVASTCAAEMPPVDAAARTGWPALLDQHEQVLRELQDAIGDPAEALWREAALDYHKARGRRASLVSYPPEELARLRRLMDSDVSLERAWSELSRRSGAAASTVEALVFGLRGGIEALRARPDRLQRLSQLSAEQIKVVCDRVENFKPEVAMPWPAEDVEALVALWSAHHV
jgi:hypothetical protein